MSMDIVVASPGRERRQTSPAILFNHQFIGDAASSFSISSSCQKIGDISRQIAAHDLHTFNTPLTRLLSSSLPVESMATNFSDDLHHPTALQQAERTSRMNFDCRLYHAVQCQLLPATAARFVWSEQFLRSTAPTRELSI